MASGPVEGGGLNAPASQAEVDAELDRITREWIEGMTPEQLRAFNDASDRRLAQFKAQVLSEIQAEGITEQEWLARQRAASEEAWAAARASRAAPQTSDADTE